jgi:hypothetical protein
MFTVFGPGSGYLVLVKDAKFHAASLKMPCEC